jgi:ubiquinone/menaquinone biosynthesis C-methylase UbiE
MAAAGLTVQAIGVAARRIAGVDRCRSERTGSRVRAGEGAGLLQKLREAIGRRMHEVGSRQPPAESSSRPAAQAGNFDHITYATFGIEPAEFYAGKFAGGPGTADHLADPGNRFNIEYGRARFLAANVKGPRVLDLGCGSAPYAQTLRCNTDARELCGVDLDPVCVAQAAQVYDRALSFDINAALPFPDQHFDTVFSCDVFGHIEFRHKDRVISEIRRVTKPGGRSVHIIESAPVDYDQMTDAPDDRLRTYVRMEGHVGVESAEALRARWFRCFRSVAVENAMLFPFCTIAGYLVDPPTPAALRQIMEGFDQSQRDAAQIVLGYACDTLIEWFRREDPTLLIPGDDNPIRRPSGLVNLLATSPL